MTETDNASNYVMYSSLNEDIDRLEATFNSLGEELRRLKAKQQEIGHKFKLDATELLDSSSKDHKRKNSDQSLDELPQKKTRYETDTVEEIREVADEDKPTKKVKRNKNKNLEETVSSDVDNANISLLEDQSTKPQKKKRKKHIVEDNFSLESAPSEETTSSKEETISERITTLEGLNLSDRIEEIKSMVSKITEQKYENKYTQEYSQQKPNNFSNKTRNTEYVVPQFNTWRKEKLSLRDKLKNGVLRLDFNGSNIAKIPGYGERVHLNELY